MNRFELRYSYFGASFPIAIGSSDLSIWLSVDPLASKYPSMSPYMYTAGNPVMLVDLDGNDWFQNEKTGDVYYNSKMHKGEEGTGAMKGKGWVHMEKNNMFNDGKNGQDDLTVLHNGEVNYHLTSTEEKGAYNLSGYAKGDKAKNMMKSQGYSFKPTQQAIYEKSEYDIESGPGGHSFTFITGKVITITEKSRYMKNDMGVIARNLKCYIIIFLRMDTTKQLPGMILYTLIILLTK